MSTPRVERLAPMARVAMAVLAIGCLTLLVIASRLNASPNGHGTHMQMGLPACGWVQAWGKPCMTCGMTTAFANAANARPLASIKAQPMGAVLAVGAAIMVWLGAYSAATGSMIVPTLIRLGNWRLVWGLVAGLLLAWAYKWFTFAA